jgi:hypothetical protein
LLGKPGASIGCLVLLMVPALSACSSGAPPQPTASFSFQRSDPVNVTEHLDPSTASAATLDASGGSVTATSRDGVTFTLVVPPGALLVSQQITLTPVSSIDGLPFHGGLSAAVHLQPDGLTFFRPATLIIRHNKPAPAGYAQIGFEYQGAGSGLHFYGTQQQGSGLEFTLMHFTSPGVGGISRQDLRDQLSHPPADNLAQVEQDIAAVIATQRQLQILSSDSVLSGEAMDARIAEYLSGYERLVLNPAVDAATKAGATFEVVATAIEEASAWKANADRFSIDEPDYPALVARLDAALPALFKSQVNACFTKDDVRAALRAYAILKFDQYVLGGDLNLPLDPIERCLHFDLDFETQLHGIRPPGGTTVEMHVKASSVPVGMASSDEGGSAPLSYLSYTSTSPLLTTPAANCAWTTISAIGTDPFRILSLEGLTIDYQQGNEWEITDFFLLVTPGTAAETVSMACRPFGHPTGSFRQGPYHDYDTFWPLFHSNQLVEHSCPTNPPNPGCHETAYAISGWQFLGGHVFARKTFQDSGHDDPLGLSGDETTTLDLYHTPQGAPIS